MFLQLLEQLFLLRDVFIGLIITAVIVYIIHRLSSTKRIVDTSRNPKEIHIVRSPTEWDHLYPTINKLTNTVKILGLDCEWLPYAEGETESRVALLQLATYDGLCVLVRLCQMSHDDLPKSLLEILANKSIIKVGVAVKDDGDKLERHYNIKVRGCVDLRHVVPRIRGFYECKSRGLYGLSEGILGYKMSKIPEVRCGNWEAPEFTHDQIHYAAMDALVGIDIYIKLLLTKILNHIPTRREMDAQFYLHKDYKQTVIYLYDGAVDKAYKFRGTVLIKPEQRQINQTFTQIKHKDTLLDSSPQSSNQSSVKPKTPDVIVEPGYCYMCGLPEPVRILRSSVEFISRTHNGKTCKICSRCDKHELNNDEKFPKI
ncbi:hypothetical protein SNE40_008903 [Patella caerulea]|uniref:Exonuclease 3'-5' domain-containing protein 2 n=1 Tax=Patella caerulea TaxID=87958 RepID=A0AAN8PPC9_PATCE